MCAADLRGGDTAPLFPVLEELGIGLVAYSPLARSFLSGAVKSRDHYTADDFRQRLACWKPGNFDANFAIAGKLTELAESKGAPVMFFAVLQEGRWPPGPAWLCPPVEQMTWGGGVTGPGRCRRRR
ncbi:aldo/keto reductase [Streptomyces sp. NPDC002215]|uniref:aldo/keto reductase n=1 Tax=Streptomyces sp. NPDC002215 TaxID=3154412 RepID=UPI003324F040